MANPKLIVTPFAETGVKNDIPESGASQPQLATMSAGFPTVTQTPINEGGIPPERADFNGLGYLTTSHLAFLNRGQWYGFDANLAGQAGGYPLHARLQLDNGDIAQSTISNNTNNPNTNPDGWLIGTPARLVIDDNGLTQQEINNGVESIEALRLLNPKGFDERIYLVSVNIGQNEGGGVFLSKSSVGMTDDGGTVISTSNPDFVYIRINYDYVTPEMFGASDGDSYAALQKAFSHDKELVLSPKIYKTSKSIWYGNNKKVSGGGYQTTVIEKITNSKESNIGSDFEVDAVLVARHWSSDDYNHFGDLSGFGLRHNAPLKGEYSLFAPRVAEATFRNIRADGAASGIYSRDAWMINWTRVTSSADNPWQILAGTSNLFANCWAKDASGVDSYAYRFENLYYSSMIACGADHCGSDLSPIKALFRVKNSKISINDCASELTHAYKFAHLETADILINGFDAIVFYNKYMNSNPSWGDENALIDARSQTKLTLTNSKFSLQNSIAGTYPKFIDISDNSNLNYRGNSTNIKITGISINDSTDFGIKYSSFTSVTADFDGVKYSYEINRGNYAPNLSTVKETTNSILSSASYFNQDGFNLTIENLNDIRGYGSCVFKQSSGGNSTISKNYPEDGGAWAIVQYSDISSENMQNNVTQIAIRKDSNRMYFRCGAWMSDFTPWYSIYHTGNTTVDEKGFLKVI